MPSYISNRDMPVFVTIPMIVSCIDQKNNSVRNGKKGARNSVAKELTAEMAYMTSIISTTMI